MEEGGKMCCWQEMFVFVSVQLQYDDNKTGKCWASRFQWLSIYDDNTKEKVQRWQKQAKNISVAETTRIMHMELGYTSNLRQSEVALMMKLWFELNHFHQVCGLLPLPPHLLHLKKGEDWSCKESEFLLLLGRLSTTKNIKHRGRWYFAWCWISTGVNKSKSFFKLKDALSWRQILCYD